jgi:hypothetical protein
MALLCPITNKQNPINYMEKNNSDAEHASKSQLTKLQSDRFYSIYHRYQEDGRKLVKVVKARGKNSWLPILHKSETVNNTTGEERKYYRSITGSFEIDVMAPLPDVIQTICEQRSRFGLEPFSDNIPGQCLNEIGKIFVFEEDTYMNHDNNPFKGIKPLFALLVD